MRFVRKGQTWIGIFLVSLIIAFIFPMKINAAGTGSITIFYHGVTKEESSIALSGAEFSLYKIAAYAENHWEFQGDFSDCTVSLSDMSASGQLKAAKEVYAYAKEKKFTGTVQKTGNDGYTRFVGIEEGLYMIAPLGDVTCNGGVFRSAPFLVCVPEVNEASNTVYDITVEPKNEWVSDDKTEEPEPPTENPGTNPGTQPGKGPELKPGSSSSTTTNVKTGDDAPVMLYVGILAVSAAVVLLIVINRRKRFSY